MTAPPVRVERRSAQRFALNLPVAIRELRGTKNGLGFTQDLSSRGVFFFTDMMIDQEVEVELTLNMPSEITLGEAMLVRCKGRILRVLPVLDAVEREQKPSERTTSASGTAKESKPAQKKFGVAVSLSGYEYLPEPLPFYSSRPQENAEESERLQAKSPA